MFYVPLAQTVNYVNSVMTRVEYQSHFISGLMLSTKLGPGALEPLVTKAMADVDPSLTFMNARTLEQQIALTFDQERAVASLAWLFGGVSLLLAAIGLYGVTAYSVAQRTNEIGIRMALGADKGAVLSLVLRSAFTRVAIGLGLGVPLAIGAGKLLAAQLYGVKFWDPVALAVATGSLTLCALVAALIPGSRAASIPPMRALRLE
jgi:ABC-type antimicrobial peptide transport system permease subunit